MAGTHSITNTMNWWIVIMLYSQWASAFYIPGWSIKSYADGETMPLFVNKVYSDNTQIQYAYSELPFVCPPSGRSRPGTGFISGSSIALNLGEVLRGDRIMVSDYELEMGKDEEMRYLCSKKVDQAGLKRAIEVVQEGYVAEWIVDNLPGATSFVSVDKSRKYYAAGFKMGYEDTSVTTGQPRYFLNNHVTLVIRFSAAPGKDGQQGKKVIVGFEVYAKSIEASNRNANGLPADQHDVQRGLELSMATKITNTTLPRDVSSNVPLQEEEDPDATFIIPYTYSVYFREEKMISWANRWDPYFVNQEDSNGIHWLAIINSLVISGLLTSMVAVILAKTIRGDIKGYKDGTLEDGLSRVGKRLKGVKAPHKISDKGGLLDQVDSDANLAADDTVSDDGMPEEITGWKLLHSDVFRVPAYGHILAPLIGSGTQLVFMSVSLLGLSCIGILNPSFRGGFVSVGLFLFIVAGSFSGYFSARMYKTFGGGLWKRNAIMTAMLFPGLAFATIFILNLFVWAQASSTAIPLGTLVALVALWLLIQLPLVYVGSWYGFTRAGAYTHPINASGIPRQIPAQPWYARNFTTALFAGFVPFAVMFIELLFVFRSLWQDKSGYYYVFGYLAVVSTVLILTVVETTIIAVYVQLCSENYHWWWQSFFLGGSSGLWIFLYCVYYYLNHLRITGLVSTMLFFSYSFLACLSCGLLTGTIGFLTAYVFVRRIYGAIKVD